jgi:predicted RNA methylase
LIIRLPDLINEATTLEDQVEKVVEEMEELKAEIVTKSLSDEALLSEAFDVIQATAGFLLKLDKKVLLKAMQSHTNKLKRKYKTKGYTMLVRREYRRDQ